MPLKPFDIIKRHLTDLQPGNRTLSGTVSAPPDASKPPTKPDDFTWRDYLLLLLKIDAGIEHALMVQYLYAAYSLGGQQVPAAQRKQVRHWQQALLSIAKEEMGHLLTVQNCITCLGGTVCLDREDYPWDSEFYPFPFELEPLTLESLAKYVYTEAPVGWGSSKKANGPFASSAERAEIEARLAVKIIQRAPIPPNPHVNSVAALFNLVLSILKDPALISDEAFNAETFSQQAAWDAWARNHGQPSGEVSADEISDGDSKKPPVTPPTTADVIIVQVATRDDVINALLQVAHQGESPHSEHEKSHFVRFLQIYREFLASFPDNSPVRPTRPLPINPTTFDHLKREDGDMARRSTLITHPVSAKWASLSDLRYRLLLTCLAHTFRLSSTHPNPTGPGTYQAITHRAFGEMYNMKALAEILVHQPLNSSPVEPFCPAGPPFQMPYSLSLPENPVSCWLQYREILASSAELIAWLQNPANATHSGREQNSSEQNYLRILANADREFNAWIDTVLNATRITGSVAS